MFLYAIQLRHGYGVAANEGEALRILIRTVDGAMGEVNGLSDADCPTLKRGGAGLGGAAKGGPGGRQAPGQQQQPNSASTSLSSTFSRRSRAQSASTASTAMGSAALRGHAAPSRSTLREIAKEELSLAVFELAQCFRLGWGVTKDKATANYYLKVAAELGDRDAQVEVAEELLKKGEKKLAARYFRKAASQGVDMPQMHWIYKDKYLDEEAKGIVRTLSI
ncbi:hypothetical protein HK101_004687 [Irineochytrium annulatum]|nr:hypothetical protein HK101_004687 [Irineochytrium annulatum]